VTAALAVSNYNTVLGKFVGEIPPKKFVFLSVHLVLACSFAPSESADARPPLANAQSCVPQFFSCQERVCARGRLSGTEACL